MTTPEFHPWLSTPEAYAAAQKSVSIPMSLMGGKATIVGSDELLSEALVILTECALPPRSQAPAACARCGGSLAKVRAGAKFCSANCRKQHAVNVGRAKAPLIPARTGAHIGSMWAWPEDQRTAYAIRQVGYCLNNYLRTCVHSIETPVDMLNSRYQAMPDGPESETPTRDRIEEYLESRGLVTDGTETLEDLAEAARHARKVAP